MKYEVRDILSVEKGIIAHGVNCHRAMGSGVALAIKTKWPVIYEEYMDMPLERQLNNLGGTQIIYVDEGLFVANCFTQWGFGGQPSDGTRTKHADESAIRNSLDKVFESAKNHDLSVYLPKIGAGLGGLLWDEEVVPEIEALEKKYGIEATVCLHDPNGK